MFGTSSPGVLQVTVIFSQQSKNETFYRLITTPSTLPGREEINLYHYTLHVKALQSTASVLLGKIKTISYTLSSFQP